MDRLWFHQIVLFPEIYQPIVMKTAPRSHSLASTVSSQSSQSEAMSSFSASASSSITEEDSSSAPSILNTESSMVDSINEEERGEDDEEGMVEEAKEEKRPERLNLVAARYRSHPSFPASKGGARRRRLRYSRKLRKSTSCRSLSELELEEVKGFMDLGFKFKEEHLSPRILYVVPGLQKLSLLRERHSSTIGELNEIAEAVANDHVQYEEEEEEEERGAVRPYLSEAWPIKRPNSPLLNLKVPRVHAAADMKRHLRSWARMVASEIQQECENS